jgi:ATP-dependent protease HslVU (ClpYQ) ATPase subunit
MADEGGEDALTPAKVVEMLDRYIVGQREAKRAVAVALRMRSQPLVWPASQTGGLMAVS